MSLFKSHRKSKITSVSFHRISDEVSPAYPPVPVKVFEKLIKYLDKNYHIISLNDIDKEYNGSKQRLILTFDDAFYDFKENALHILKKYDLPSVLNAIPSCLDTGETFWTQKLNKIIEWYYFNGIPIQDSTLGLTNTLLNKKNIEKIGIDLYQKLLPLDEKIRDSIVNNLAKKHQIDIFQDMLTWNDIEYCKKNNVVIGNHTMNHVNLTTLSRQELKKELELSNLKFKENIGFIPNVIAFPNGQYNNSVIEECIQYKYKYLFTTENSSFKLAKSDNLYPLLIPRIDLHSKTLWKNILRLTVFSSKIKTLNGLYSQQQKNETCLCCESTKLKMLEGYEKDYLVKCQSCGFVFASRKPTEENLIEHYSQYSRDDYLPPLTIVRYNEILDVMEKYRKTNNLLDIGSGMGYFLDEAKKRGWNVYGTEFTDEAINIGKEKGLIMHKGMLDPKNYKPENFDVITSFEVIEHINNPIDEMRSINEILRKGGVFYCTTPNFNSFSRLYLKNKWNNIQYPEHLSYYTLSYYTLPTLKKLLRNNNLYPIKNLTTGVSLTRIKTSRLGLKENEPISATSIDELLRNQLEKKFYYRVLKNILNTFLTWVRLGDTIKIFAVKK
jgi:peptidoglycan/xylan/chitin deacetylase (PgdA/CDA1 family)/SAM-dependent methyltransferase